MSMFRYDHLHLFQYRCFEALDLALEPDLTLLFAENGGGKTAVLTALAMGLTAFQPGSPKSVRLDPQRDPRQVTLDGGKRREPAGTCSVDWKAAIGDSDVVWSTEANPASGRRKTDHALVHWAIEQVRVPGARWPLFAFYGVDRMARGRASTTSSAGIPDRWEGYAGCLDPAQDDSGLLTWLLEAVLDDTVRRRNNLTERFLDAAVMDTLAKAAPGVSRAWFDPGLRSPTVLFNTGEAAPWRELSDGFHVFLALVADIARRAVILNEQDGGDAAALAEGVVMIDEIDLHLHPRWQRGVLDGLRAAFPKLQFVVTTHSPQVLSSALNRQVRLLRGGGLWPGTVHVEGRDSNAIMREYFQTDDRDPQGAERLKALDNAIDAGRGTEARARLAELLNMWGTLDPDLIRRKSRVERLA